MLKRFLKSLFDKFKMIGFWFKKHAKDWRFYTLWTITICFILLAIFVFKDSYLRFAHSIRDIGLSIVYYFCKLFDIETTIEPSVTVIDSSYNVRLFWIPEDFASFLKKIGIYFISLFNLDSLTIYFQDFVLFVADFSRILLIVFPFFFLFYFWFMRYFEVNEFSIDEEESKPLRFYKNKVFKLHQIIKSKLNELINFFFSERFFRISWILIWLFSFNIFTVIFEFVAFYLYFVVSFDFANIFIQIYKLLCDLKAIPLFIMIIAFIIFLRLERINIAYSRLHRYEMRNRGFLNSLGLIVLITGVTGKGKTLMMTDLALSNEVMLRDKAFEKILFNDAKFPNFPFATFESKLKRAMTREYKDYVKLCHKDKVKVKEITKVYSLATCEKWISEIRAAFESTYHRDAIFGYDYEKYGLYHNNGLTNEYIFDMLENYAKLYFIYSIQSSLLISNYGIRVDNVLSSANHFPMWDSDFFGDPVKSEFYTRHSHIIDFDILRLGKKVSENNPLSDSVEFGIYVITEFDKERGNQLTNQSYKADSLEANPKNDLTELCEKIHRHSSTVDNYPFLRIFADSQRSQSIMADNRETAEKIVNITDVGNTKNALLFFFFDELIYDFFLRRFEKWYYKYRYSRSDNTLFMYFFHKICAYFISSYKRKENLFGFAVYSGLTSRSSDESISEKFKWYRLHKKIFANRYKTNCFKDFWNKKSLKSQFGLNDLKEYHSTQASIEEMKMQHSYWINTITEVSEKES